MRRYTRLGNDLRAARKQAGFSSQEKLADALGTSRNRVLTWEGGKHRPNLRYRALLEVVLASTFDWSADVEPMTPEEQGAVERTERRVEEMVA